MIRTDLGLVVGLVVGAGLALLVPGVPWQVAWAFGLPFLVAVPGYAIVAALFPVRPGAPTDGADPPGWAARLGLALVGSAVVVGSVATVLAAGDAVRLALAPVVLVVGGMSLLAVGVAAARRSRLPVDRRADPLAGASPSSATGAFGTSGAQTVALVLSALVLATALAFAGTSPVDDPYSEAYLTGDGDLATENGTPTLSAGEGATVALAIENHEGEPTDYRVVIRLQRVGPNGTVLEQHRLDAFGATLAANGTGVYERRLEPSMTGERLRLQILVYEGELDGTVGPGTADLSLRLWVTVEGESA